MTRRLGLPQIDNNLTQEEITTMEFTLFYRGPLKTNGRPEHKHEIRYEFHKQLQVLWQQPPLDSKEGEGRLTPYSAYLNGSFAKKFSRCDEDFIFAAVVWEPMNVTADLDITFLRHGKPGAIIGIGGDIDNRLKTLFDALKIPDLSKNELPADIHPSDLDDPFHCVLEDDALISALSIRTDRLLSPDDATDESEVQLVIRVRTRILAANNDNLSLL